MWPHSSRTGNFVLPESLGWRASIFTRRLLPLLLPRPERPIPPPDVLVAPADGRIVSIRQFGPHETRVSIFLNIFNVHVNRTPIPGL